MFNKDHIRGRYRSTADDSASTSSDEEKENHHQRVKRRRKSPPAIDLYHYNPGPNAGVSRSVRTNYNPFVHEHPSLISVSTTGSSPNNNLSFFNNSYALQEDKEEEAHINATLAVCNKMNRSLSFADDATPIAPPKASVAQNYDQAMNTTPDVFTPPPPTASMHVTLGGGGVGLMQTPMHSIFQPGTPPTHEFGHFQKNPPRPLFGRLGGDKFRAADEPSSPVNLTPQQPLPVATRGRLDDEFEVLASLGGGTFGNVLKVKKRLDGCLYAIKVIKDVVRGRNHRERVLKEVYALAALWENNEHILRYYSSWIEDGRLYIQTELCDTSLEDVLRSGGRGVVDRNNVEPYAREMLRQLSTGLRCLHSSAIAHLDIKPANILVKAGVFKLGDLGHVAMDRQHAVSLPPPPPMMRRSGGFSNLPSPVPTIHDTTAQSLFSTFDSSENQDSDDSASPLRISLALRKMRTTAAASAALVDDEEDEEYLQQQSAINSAVDVDEGDARYMPRELLNQNHDHLFKADIFSLGLSAYEMFLDGQALPLNGPGWHELREGRMEPKATERMSHEFKRLLSLMIHPDPSKRPSADALLEPSGLGHILLKQEELDQERLKREVDFLRSLHPAVHFLKRSNTM